MEIHNKKYLPSRLAWALQNGVSVYSSYDIAAVSWTDTTVS